jgi:hypothetical protein
MQRHNDAAIPFCFPAYDTAAVVHLSGARATLTKIIFSAHIQREREDSAEADRILRES